jgi:hypothetical protein
MYFYLHEFDLVCCTDSRGNQSTANMMMGFSNNPPGAIPPPTISPAPHSEKYDRPKEAHSSSNNSLQQVGMRPSKYCAFTLRVSHVC